MISEKEYSEAHPDPVCTESRDVLTTFNEEKNINYLRLLCKEYADEDVNEPILYHVDRYGFNVLAKTVGVII